MFGNVVYIQNANAPAKLIIFLLDNYLLRIFICCTICTRVKSIDFLAKVLKFY